MQCISCTLSHEWGQCLAHFLDQACFSPSTRVNYRQILFDFFASGLPPDTVVQQDVLNYLCRPANNNRGKGPVSISRRNNRLTALSSFYRFASYYVPSSCSLPLFQRPSPTLGIAYGATPKTYRFLSYYEMESFFAAIPDTLIGKRDRCLCLLYFWTARRLSEIAELRRGDLFEGIITDSDVRRRQGWLYHFRGKGRKHELDTAEMPPEAMSVLVSYLEASGRSLSMMKPGDPLFVAIGPAQGGYELQRDKPLSGSAINRRMKEYARLAGIDPSTLSSHVWRHTMARELFSETGNLRAVQNLLRHANIGVTDVYIRILVGTADPTQSLVGRFGKFSHI